MRSYIPEFRFSVYAPSPKEQIGGTGIEYTRTRDARILITAKEKKNNNNRNIVTRATREYFVTFCISLISIRMRSRASNSSRIASQDRQHVQLNNFARSEVKLLGTYIVNDITDVAYSKQFLSVLCH